MAAACWWCSQGVHRSGGTHQGVLLHPLQTDAAQAAAVKAAFGSGNSYGNHQAMTMNPLAEHHDLESNGADLHEA